MTAKTYRQLAAALSTAMHTTLQDPDGHHGAAQRGGIALAAQRLADTLQADNPKFDRARFLAAAGASDA